jgi:K+-sensing histidine kinase KdpD
LTTEDHDRHHLQTQFLASISHEFRTPLAGMKISLELLMENARYLSFTEMNELLASLYLSVQTMQHLIDNLLESGKIEAQHFSLRRQKTDVHTILRQSLQMMQPLLNRKQQTLSLDQPLSLPPLFVDEARLVQVLVNLLSNASKYSPMSSQIDMFIDQHGGEIYLAIADRGSGVPAERREAVFERFIRLEDGHSAEQGVGLGLPVAKAIVEGHGGKMGVDEREGGGAVFWLTLSLESHVP